MPTYLTLDQIRQQVEELMRRIDAPRNLQPTYGYSDQMATPEIDVDACGYLYLVCERGDEYERFSSPELDAILEKVFDIITFTMACDYELHHRARRLDSRRLIFSTQLELLGRLSPAWRDHREQHLARILIEHPFSDE